MCVRKYARVRVRVYARVSVYTRVSSPRSGTDQRNRGGWSDRNEDGSAVYPNWGSGHRCLKSGFRHCGGGLLRVVWRERSKPQQGKRMCGCDGEVPGTRLWVKEVLGPGVQGVPCL